MLPQFKTELDLSPCPDGRTWRLDQDFVYQSAIVAPVPLGIIAVPAGFMTDLASIPRLFWDILPPFGKYTKAAVVHDWLYRHHLFPRATCDAVLLEAMQLCGVGWISRQLIYHNVRAFGWAAWAAEPPGPVPKTANGQSPSVPAQLPEP